MHMWNQPACSSCDDSNSKQLPFKVTHNGEDVQEVTLSLAATKEDVAVVAVSSEMVETHGKDVSSLLPTVLGKILVKHRSSSQLTTGSWHVSTVPPPLHQWTASSCRYLTQQAVRKYDRSANCDRHKVRSLTMFLAWPPMDWGNVSFVVPGSRIINRNNYKMMHHILNLTYAKILWPCRLQTKMHEPYCWPPDSGHQESALAYLKSCPESLSYKNLATNFMEVQPNVPKGKRKHTSSSWPL